MTLIPFYETVTPFATGGDARVWTTRKSGVTTVPVGLTCSARFFAEAGIGGQPLASCSSFCCSSGLKFNSAAGESWLQVDLIDSIIANAGWATSYPGPPDLEADPPTFTPSDHHVYKRARVGLFGSFVETWFKFGNWNHSNDIFTLGYDLTLVASATGYVEVEKWQQSVFYDGNALGDSIHPPGGVEDGPSGQWCERWNRVTFVHIDIVFSGADIAPGFPATGTLEWGTPGGSGAADSTVTAYPYPELTLTNSSVAYASAQSFGNTVFHGSGLVVEGQAQATGASCPFSRSIPFGAGHITQDADTGRVTITNPENPGSNNFVALLMNQDGPISLTFNGSVKRLDQPMTPTPVEFFIPALSSLPGGAFRMGDVSGGFAFSQTWPQYAVREGRPFVDPASSILAQSDPAPESPTAHIELSGRWMHNPNYALYPPGMAPNGIDIVNDSIDTRIMANEDLWDAMTLEHRQTLAIPGSWAAGGDAVLSGGKWSSASGTGYLVRTIGPALDAEGYGKLKLTLATDDAPRNLFLWANKQTFNSTTGHEGKQFGLKTVTTGVAHDNIVNLCLPLNPLANSDEFGSGPITRTPDPGRDVQESRWPVWFIKFPSGFRFATDFDGPYWGIGGGLSELRIEGLTAGELYTVGEPELIVDKTDTIDMIAGNGNFGLRRDEDNDDGGVFGFTGLADEKQTGDWPYILFSTEIHDSGTWQGLALDGAGGDRPAHGRHNCTITDLCTIINSYPDWIAVAATTTDALNNADRPAPNLNGWGALGGWNTDLTAGAVTIQATQLWDYIFDQGGSVSHQFTKVIGAAFAGIIGDGTGAPNPVDGVDAYAQTDPMGLLDVWTEFGSGNTNSEGLYKTGAPYLIVRNHPGRVIGDIVSSSLVCRSQDPGGIGTFTGSFSDLTLPALRGTFFHRRRWRGAFRDPFEPLAAPWNCEHPSGLIRSAIAATGVLKWWHTWQGLPPWKDLHGLPVATSDLVVRSRMAVRPDRRILHLIELAAPTGGVWEIDSNNDGRTWGTASLLFAGASYPGVAAFESGVELRWAVLSGAVVSTLRQPGGVISGTLGWIDGATGDPLSVADDTFQVLESRRPGRPILAHLQIVGDTNTSLWRCMSEARAVSDGHLTWRKITCPGILGAHPQIAEDRAGDLFLAAYHAGAIDALSQRIGETTWSVYTFGGIAVNDDCFGLSGAYESSRRLALSCVITGEAAPSEWWSANGGVSWHRSVQ